MSVEAQPCIRCALSVPAELVACPHCHFELGSGEAPEAWLGETIDQKYIVEEILGVGGMGMVFKARRLLIGDIVALKILFPKFLKSDLQRRLFQDEAVATAQLDHPSVIRVYDADIDPEFGVAYIAMEHLVGFPFKELMLAEAPMKPERLYPIFIQVCDGLSSAHQAGIIHRDLKPDNIFLTRGPNGEFDVKILDFGIATVMGVVNQDEQNKLLGTLRYMAPEQCKGEPATPQTDLYAIGIILYEALTRQRAAGKSVEAVLYDPIIPPSERLPSDQAPPQHLEALVMKLLNKNSALRPLSALETRAALEALRDPFNTPQQVVGAATYGKGKNTSQAVVSRSQEREWAQGEHTPIVEGLQKGGVSIMWYLIPLSLVGVLIYLIKVLGV